MPFCSNCGAEYQTGSKFCSSCGKSFVNNVVDNGNTTGNNTVSSIEETTIWEGKPAGIIDNLKDKANLNATQYILTNQRLIIKTGLIGKKQEDIELIRVKDIRVQQSLKDRMLNVGLIQVISTDPATPVFTLEEVKDPNNVKELIRGAMKKEKTSQGLKYEERL